MVRTNIQEAHACCYWLTGLPAPGKSTLSHLIRKRLQDLGYLAISLDGGHLRRGINSDLGYSSEDRSENVRRIAEIAKLIVDAGAMVLVSAISLYQGDRASARAKFAPGYFFEVFVDADIETCMRRDPKGLYARAKSGLLADFTGCGAPYEKPEVPELTLDTTLESADSLTQRVIDHFLSKVASPHEGSDGSALHDH